MFKKISQKYPKAWKKFGEHYAEHNTRDKTMREKYGLTFAFADSSEWNELWIINANNEGIIGLWGHICIFFDEQEIFIILEWEGHPRPYALYINDCKSRVKDWYHLKSYKNRPEAYEKAIMAAFEILEERLICENIFNLQPI